MLSIRPEPMLYFARGSSTDQLADTDLRAGLQAALDQIGPRQRVVVVPPDFTRWLLISVF